MKQINEKLNKIAKAIDETVELPETNLITDSLDAITKALGGTPNDSNLIVDKLDEIAGVAEPKPTGNIELTENAENVDVAQYATATVNVSGGGGEKEEYVLAPEIDYAQIEDWDGMIITISPLPVPLPDTLKIKLNDNNAILSFGYLYIEDWFSGYAYYNESANIIIPVVLDIPSNDILLGFMPYTPSEDPPASLELEIKCENYPPFYSILKTTIVNDEITDLTVSNFIDNVVIYALVNNEVEDVKNMTVPAGDSIELDIIINNLSISNGLHITSDPSNLVNCFYEDSYIHFDTTPLILTNAEITLTRQGAII